MVRRTIDYTRSKQFDSTRPVYVERKTTGATVQNVSRTKYHTFLHFEEDGILCDYPGQEKEMREQIKRQFELERQKLRWSFNEGINYKKYLAEKLAIITAELGGEEEKARVILGIAIQNLMKDMKEVITNEVTGKIQPSKEISDLYINQTLRSLRKLDLEVIKCGDFDKTIEKSTDKIA